MMVQIQMYCVIKFCVGAQKMFTKERVSWNASGRTEATVELSWLY